MTNDESLAWAGAQAQELHMLADAIFRLAVMADTAVEMARPVAARLSAGDYLDWPTGSREGVSPAKRIGAALTFVDMVAKTVTRFAATVDLAGMVE